MEKAIIQKTQNSKQLLSKSNAMIDITNKLTLGTLLKSQAIKSVSGKIFVGIDFGTSTTVVSIASSNEGVDKIKSIPIELNQKMYDGGIYRSFKIPTVVAWHKEALLVGEGARAVRLKLTQGKNLWHSFKMELGEDFGCRYPESELNNEKIKILNPKDVATLFFKYLKTQIQKYAIENNLIGQIEYAVSIPASFEANQRKDLLESLQANNIMIGKQALIDEPNAAFLSYICDEDLKNQISINENFPTNILVFDFGAGTCDISILEIANTTKGYQSKNLAISRFEALGGNDLDKLIAENILLPQFLKENSIEKSLFKSKDINRHILPRLEKVAEILKIKISEQLSLLTNDKINQVIYSDAYVTINQTTEIKLRNETFALVNPKMSYTEFREINEQFTDMCDDGCCFSKTVFSPIMSALNKANLSSQDIDYILFIGGSAKNPLIQKAIKDYFPESEYLIPQNLQSHVSSGAAIHSLMFNGYGKNIINPITSEPIIVIIKQDGIEDTKVLLKAGTTIPCETVTIDYLRPQRDGQLTIEIPLCVGVKEKLLHNIALESNSPEGFNTDSKIILQLLVSADKMLIVSAKIDGFEAKVSPLNPFSNQETSDKDRLVFEAEKKYNMSISKNSGQPSRSDLLNLYNKYKDLELHLKAAETLEELHEKFNHGSLNNIGVCYSNAGDEERAMVFYKKAMEKATSEITAVNIALKYKYSDRLQYKEWLKKALQIDPNYNLALYLYGVELINNNEDEKGKQFVNKAFDSWKYEYENNRLSAHISWFVSCARYLKKYEYADKIEQSAQRHSDANDSLYKADNLSSIATNN